MRTFSVASLTLAILILLTGCWNRMELDSYAFVQAIAVDKAKGKENIELTMQFYKPVAGGKKPTSGPSGQNLFNIKTRGETVFEAVRDMTFQVGRKAQWSHMRVLIIGEEIAKKRNIGEIIDFFSRDNEPRATVDVMIGEERAELYLKTPKPFIEATMGQQLRESERMASQFTGKSIKTSFLDLMLELKGETGVAAIPYVYFDPKNKPISVPVTKMALMKKGKMVTLVPSENIRSLVMLMNKFKSGIIEVACSDQSKKKSNKMEAVEVESVKTKLDVKIKGDSAAVHAAVQIKGYSGELVCTSLKSTEDVAKFNEKVKKKVEQDMRGTLDFLQKQKMDILGIGTRIYRQNPVLWKRWKPDWEERFASLPFSLKVDVSIINLGANLGEPVSK